MIQNTIFVTQNTLLVNQIVPAFMSTVEKRIPYALGEYNPGRWENIKRNVEPCAPKRGLLIVESCHIRPLLYFAANARLDGKKPKRPKVYK